MKSNPVADLVTLSYAKLLQQDTAEANRLLYAAQQEGIFYLGFDASHQLSELRNNVNTLFDLGAQTMENEKCELEQYSTFAGDKKIFSTRYRKPGMQVVDDKGHRDRTEFINVRENDLFLSDARLDLPHSVNDRRETLTSFAALCFGVSSTLLRNLELALGMPRDMLTNMHSTTRANSNRIAVTRSVTNSDEVEVDVPALGAHRDAGSLTVLFNRLSGLQVTQGGEWRWVPAKPECAVINVGEALANVTSNSLRAPLHRVMTPSVEKAIRVRYSVAYFLRPDDEADLTPWDGNQPFSKATTQVTGGDWNKGRLDAVCAGKLDNYVEA